LSSPDFTSGSGLVLTVTPVALGLPVVVDVVVDVVVEAAFMEEDGLVVVAKWLELLEELSIWLSTAAPRS
jgi:hypothetical protein